MRRAGTLMSLASRYWLMPPGTRNSAFKISPGCTGAGFDFFITSLLVVVDDFNLVCMPAFPFQIDSPLVDDAHRILAFPVAFQPLQMVRQLHSKIIKRNCSVYHS